MIEGGHGSCEAIENRNRARPSLVENSAREETFRVRRRRGAVLVRARVFLRPPVDERQPGLREGRASARVAAPDGLARRGVLGGDLRHRRSLLRRDARLPRRLTRRGQSRWFLRREACTLMVKARRWVSLSRVVRAGHTREFSQLCPSSPESRFLRARARRKRDALIKKKEKNNLCDKKPRRCCPRASRPRSDSSTRRVVFFFLWRTVQMSVGDSVDNSVEF